MTQDLVRFLLVNSLGALPVAAVAWLLERAAWRAGPAWVAGLWSVVLLRLVLPPGLGVLLPIDALPGGHASTGVGAPAVAAIWLAGVATTALGGWTWAAASLRAMAGEALPAPRRQRIEAIRLARAMGLRHLPVILVHPHLRSPLVIGILRPRLFLPAQLHDRSILRAALAHELAHLHRLDPWRSRVVALVVALFWFHPLAWLAARRLRDLREFACDELASRFHESGARGYARALAAFAPSGAVRLQPGLAWTRRRVLLVRRVEHLLTRARPRRVLAAGGVLASLLAAICCAPVAPACAEPLPPAGCLQLRYTVMRLLAEQEPAGTPMSR